MVNGNSPKAWPWCLFPLLASAGAGLGGGLRSVITACSFIPAVPQAHTHRGQEGRMVRSCWWACGPAEL